MRKILKSMYMVINTSCSAIDQILKNHALKNNIGCVDGTIIGTGRSDYTQGSTAYNLTIGNKKFLMIDIPGIEGDESKYEEIIQSSLDKAHVIFFVNGSGKKIEKGSLEKIKRYMHDGTSLYAIFNTHCKAKKERIIGIDKTYSEELTAAYKMQKKIAHQTEKELKSFLGDSFRGSICINGLLAFCAVAIGVNDETTIKEEEDKSLRHDQIKYLKEYQGNLDKMICESHINEIQKIIKQKSSSFEEDIHYENLKKLKNRLIEMVARINELKTREDEKITGFIKVYNEFEERCSEAKDDFIFEMKHIARNAVSDAFDGLTNELFEKIEKDEGKTKKEDIQAIFNTRKNDLVFNIQSGVNNRIERARKTFLGSIEDAQERLKRDFERQQINFQVNLATSSMALDSSFESIFSFDWKDFGKHILNVASLAAGGAAIGSAIPGLGTAIGAAIGAGVGIALRVWNHFVSKEKRINKAKAEIQHAIDEQIDKTSAQLNDELEKMRYEQKIENVFGKLHESIEGQKRQLRDVRSILQSVANNMDTIQTGMI